jgi:hypothetical protein
VRVRTSAWWTSRSIIDSGHDVVREGLAPTAEGQVRGDHDGALLVAAGELTWAPEATWDALHEMLLTGPWHVLHFIGHGDFDPDRDEGVLALARQDGRADLVEASRFADLLRQARPMPRLAVLNSSPVPPPARATCSPGRPRRSRAAGWQQ